MNGNLLQRSFVNLIYDMLEEDMRKENPLYPTNTDFAKKAFPHEGNPAKIWQYLKRGQKGKQRGVSIEDAYGMALAFGEKLDRLLVKAEMRIESGWKLEDDVFFKEEQRKGGRPKKIKDPAKKDHITVPLSSPELRPPEDGAINQD